MSEQLRDWLYGRLPRVESVPDGWRLVRLTDVARLESGHTPSRSVPSYWNGDIQWLSLHDTSQLDNHVICQTRYTITPAGIANSAARLLPEGTVALSRTATVGKCAILGREMATTQDFACYVPGASVKSKFLMHLFRFMQPVWRALSGGSTHQTVYMPIFEQLRILLPPVTEQQKIAELLDTVDEAIRKTEQVIAKLNQVKQGLLHDLLTRGIDDNGELRDPERHPEQFQDCPLGRIPKAWEAMTLGEHLRRIGGFLQTGPFGSQLHSYEYSAEGTPVVMPQDITEDWISVGSVARVPETIAARLRRHRMKVNDVVFARRGDLSRCAPIGIREVDWLCGTGCLLARIPQDALDAEWLAAAYRHHTVQRQVDGRAVGTTMVNLNTSILQALVLGIPPRGEQKLISCMVREHSRRIAKEGEELSKLRLLKAGLAEDLLTGRVRTTNLLEPSP